MATDVAARGLGNLHLLFLVTQYCLPFVQPLRDTKSKRISKNVVYIFLIIVLQILCVLIRKCSSSLFVRLILSCHIVFFPYFSFLFNLFKRSSK